MRKYMRLIEGRASTAALLVINLALVVMVALELRAPLPEMAAPAEATRSAETRLELPTARPLLAQLSDYQEITERPLFWSERRGFVGGAVADAAQTNVPFVLLGVVTGTKSKALLAKPDGKEVTRASKGEVVEGWLIEEVGPQSVTLVSGNLRRELLVGAGVSKGNSRAPTKE